MNTESKATIPLEVYEKLKNDSEKLKQVLMSNESITLYLSYNNLYHVIRPEQIMITASKELSRKAGEVRELIDRNEKLELALKMIKNHWWYKLGTRIVEWL